jgi:hypothetical protein
MATSLTVEQVKAQFPNAWKTYLEEYDLTEEDIQEEVSGGEMEFWVHNGALYSRVWWTAQGWHYGVALESGGWVCPSTGECKCPWE